jgi:hypothetical protein
MTKKPSYEQLIVLLDGCIPAIEAAARHEAKKDRDRYGLKEITWQKRLEAARAYVAASGVDL